MTQTLRYGRPDFYNRNNMDTVRVVNEDDGLNANLVTGTNDTFESTIPYPSEWDQEDETMHIYRFRFMLPQSQQPVDDSWRALGMSLSMIDRSAAATYRGNLTDVEDEWFKSQFTPNMFYGTQQSHTSPATGVEVVQLSALRNVDAEFIPQWGPLPTFYPIFKEIWGQSGTVSNLGADGNASFTDFENSVYEYDYTIRKMTSRERNIFQGLPGIQSRLAQLSS